MPLSQVSIRLTSQSRKDAAYTSPRLRLPTARCMHNGFFSQPAPVTSGQGVFGIPCILRKACGIKKGWMFAIEQAALAQGVIAPIESLHGQRSDIQQASEESDMFRFGGNPPTVFPRSVRIFLFHITSGLFPGRSSYGSRHSHLTVPFRLSVHTKRVEVFLSFLTMQTYATVTYDMQGVSRVHTPLRRGSRGNTAPSRGRLPREKRTLHAHRVHDPRHIR